VILDTSLDLNYIYTSNSYRAVNILLFGYKTNQLISYIKVTALRSLQNKEMPSEEKNVRRNVTKQITKF